MYLNGLDELDQKNHPVAYRKCTYFTLRYR